MGRRLLSPGERKILFAPAADSAVHGEHVGVTHFLQIVGRQSGAISSAAIEHDWRIQFGYSLLNVTFYYAFAQVNRSGQMVLGVLALFPDIDQEKLFATIEFGFD